MPSLSIDQLLPVVPTDSARQTVIDLLTGLGITAVTSWQPGSLARTLGLELPALLINEFSKTAALIAAGGYNKTAQGDWLTLYSESAYDNLRFDPVRTRGNCVLTATASAAATPVAASYVVVAEPISGVTFRNVNAFTPVPGGSVTVVFEAERAGSSGNVLVGSITSMQTPIAGVSVSNPGVGGSWITRWGANAEGDPSLQDRNRTKWATRAYAAPGDAYVNWAREADPTITRATVDDQNPDGPNTLRIYIAGDLGAGNIAQLDTTLAQKVVDYIYGRIDGVSRRGLNAIVNCSPATVVTQELTGTAYVAAPYLSSAPAALNTALQALQDALPIGGALGGAGFRGLLFSALYSVVMQTPGIVNVAFATPIADVPLAMNQVVQLVNNLTYVGV